MNRPRLHVFFDYDLTLSPGESEVDVMRLALASQPDATSLVAQFETLRSRWAIGRRAPSDIARVFRWMRLVERQHVAAYIAARQRLDHAFSATFAALRVEGAALHILSSTYSDWIEPIGRSWGFSENDIHARYRLGWTGDRAHPLTPSHIYSPSKTAIVRTLRRNGRIAGPVVMVGDSRQDLRVFQNGEADWFVCADYFTPSPIPAEETSASWRISRVGDPLQLAGTLLTLLRRMCD